MLVLDRAYLRGTCGCMLPETDRSLIPRYSSFPENSWGNYKPSWIAFSCSTVEKEEHEERGQKCSLR